MTIIDIVLFLILLVLIYMGFSSGVLKVAAVTLGMYGGLQVAALFYEIFARITATPGDANSATTSQVVWFFALWVVWTIIFTLIAWYFLGSIKLPTWTNNIDQLLGLGLGFFAAIFALFVVSFVMKNTFTMIWYGSGRPSNWMLEVKMAFDNSFLMGLFQVLKVVYLNILSPWLPNKNLPVFQNL